MPIQFECPKCAATIRAPDGSSGKSCICPSCQKLTTIPTADTPGRSSVLENGSSRTSVGAQSTSAKIGDSGDNLYIPCPRCQNILEANPSQIGTPGLCPACWLVFAIPQRSERAQIVGSHEAEFAFRCPDCGQWFEGKHGMENRKGKCHQCQAVFNITPAEKVAVQKEIPKRSQVAAKLPEAVIQTSLPVELSCGNCLRKVRVTGASPGTSVSCPACSQAIVVPSARPNDVGGARNRIGPPAVPSNPKTRPASLPQQESSGSRFGTSTSPSGSKSRGAFADQDPFGTPISPSSSPTQTSDPFGGIDFSTPATNPYAASSATYAPVASRSTRPKPSGGPFVRTFDDTFGLFAAHLHYYLILIGLSAAVYLPFILGTFLASGTRNGLISLLVIIFGGGLAVIGSLMIFSSGFTFSGRLAKNRRATAKDLIPDVYHTLSYIAAYFVIAIVSGLISGAMQVTIATIISVLGPGTITLVLVIIAIVIGLLCLLAFTISVAMTYVIIAVDDVGPMEAMNRSSTSIKENLGLFFGVSICGGLLVTAAVILSIGLATPFAIAFSALLQCVLYRTMKENY